VSLKQKLMDDLKIAMREKDTIRKDAVQMVRSSILQIEKDNQLTLDDEGVLDVISKEVKKRRDVLPDYVKSGRQELIDNLNTEIKILLVYLPQQLTEAEIDVLVKEAIAEVGASSMKDIGKVMTAIMPKTKGRADGKIINELVKKNLA